jgi:hypothetical protein
VAYEWIGTGALGIVGIVFTWLTGKQARDQAEQTAEKRLEHERTMAREARDQERLANAYVRLLGMVERIGQWTQMVKPMLDTNPPQPVRALPDLDEQAEAQALVNAFGSDEVREAFESWRNLVWKITLAVGEIDREQESGERYRPGTSDSNHPYLRLHGELRPAEIKARKELAARIRAELQAVRTS